MAVELRPELLVLQRHLGVVLHVVLLGRRGPEPGPGREGEAWQSGHHAGVTWADMGGAFVTKDSSSLCSYLSFATTLLVEDVNESR